MIILGFSIYFPSPLEKKIFFLILRFSLEDRHSQKLYTAQSWVRCAILIERKKNVTVTSAVSEFQSRFSDFAIKWGY